MCNFYNRGTINCGCGCGCGLGWLNGLFNCGNQRICRDACGNLHVYTCGVAATTNNTQTTNGCGCNHGCGWGWGSCNRYTTLTDTTATTNGNYNGCYNQTTTQNTGGCGCCNGYYTN